MNKSASIRPKNGRKQPLVRPQVSSAVKIQKIDARVWAKAIEHLPASTVLLLNNHKHKFDSALSIFAHQWNDREFRPAPSKLAKQLKKGARACDVLADIFSGSTAQIWALLQEAHPKDPFISSLALDTSTSRNPMLVSQYCEVDKKSFGMLSTLATRMDKAADFHKKMVRRPHLAITEDAIGKLVSLWQEVTKTDAVYHSSVRGSKKDGRAGDRRYEGYFGKFALPLLQAVDKKSGRAVLIKRISAARKNLHVSAEKN